jgi:WD40 repeat protein
MKHLITAGLALLPLAAHAQSTPSSAELAKRVEAMAQIPSTFSPVYSRDGKRLAFLSNRSGTPQVWVIDAAGGEPKQVTQGSDPVGSVEWSPVEDRIAYDVARGGGYNAQVFYSKPDGSDARLVTSGGKEDNFAGSFAPDGRYWFRSAQRDPVARFVDLRSEDGQGVDCHPVRRRIRQHPGHSAACPPGIGRAPRHSRQHQLVPARPAD